MDNIINGIANFRVDTMLSAVDRYVPGAQNKIKNLADKAKAYVNNVTELEMKVLEATNHEPWGPHGSVMQELTQDAFNVEAFYQIMGVVDQRLSEGPENWRLVYKALLLLEYMCKHGPMSVVEALNSYSRMALLERLRDRFDYKDPMGRDQGINVRQRAGALVTLVTDRDKLTEERNKAAKNRSKYTGVSSGASRYGGFAGGAAASSSSYAGGGGGGSSGAGYGGYGDSSGVSSSHAYGDGGSGAAAVASAAAVEATRQRIARLKASGAIDGSSGDVIGGGGGGSGDGAAADGGADSPSGAGGGSRKPKKLSDVRINPAISATLAKPGAGLAPPPSSRPAAAASGIDLLAELDGPAAVPLPAAAGGGGNDWDAFAAAPSAAPSTAAAAAAAAGRGGDDWGAFDSAPPAVAGSGGLTGATAAAARPAVDVTALLGPLPTVGAGGAGKAPLPLDDFCSAPAALPGGFDASFPAASGGVGSSGAQPMMPPAATADPFAVVAAAGPASAAVAAAADPFAASSGVQMLPGAPSGRTGSSSAPKLGPGTARDKDPFADLALM